MILSLKIYLAFAILINFSLSQINSTNTYYCQPDSRDRTCTMEYLGVCGWFAKNVNCFVYPCAITSGTFCQACQNKDVEYVTMGECPKTNSLNVNPGNNTVIYTLPYVCQAEDRNRNCTMFADNNLVCANNADCSGTNCKFTSKPCEACLIPSVEKLTGFATCFAIFRKLDIYFYFISVILVLI